MKCNIYLKACRTCKGEDMSRRLAPQKIENIEENKPYRVEWNYLGWELKTRVRYRRNRYLSIGIHGISLVTRTQQKLITCSVLVKNLMGTLHSNWRRFCKIYYISLHESGLRNCFGFLLANKQVYI